MAFRRLISMAILCVVSVAGVAQKPERKPMVVVISLDAFGAALLAQPLDWMETTTPPTGAYGARPTAGTSRGGRARSR
jgi:hypothetical protein